MSPDSGRFKNHYKSMAPVANGRYIIAIHLLFITNRHQGNFSSLFVLIEFIYKQSVQAGMAKECVQTDATKLTVLCKKFGTLVEKVKV